MHRTIFEEVTRAYCDCMDVTCPCHGWHGASFNTLTIANWHDESNGLDYCHQCALHHFADNMTDLKERRRNMRLELDPETAATARGLAEILNITPEEIVKMAVMAMGSQLAAVDTLVEARLRAFIQSLREKSP